MGIDGNLNGGHEDERFKVALGFVATWEVELKVMGWNLNVALVLASTSALVLILAMKSPLVLGIGIDIGIGISISIGIGISISIDIGICISIGIDIDIGIVLVSAFTLVLASTLAWVLVFTLALTLVLELALALALASTFGFVSAFLTLGFFSFEIVALFTIWYQLALCFPVLSFSWQTLNVYNSHIMSLSGKVKLYYIIEYNIFLLFVGFFFYFGKFLIFSTLAFVSYFDSSSKSM